MTALTELTEEKRQKGYRPVLMIDANGDYTETNGEMDPRDLIRCTGLVDHYREKLSAPTHTFIRGSKKTIISSLIGVWLKLLNR